MSEDHPECGSTGLAVLPAPSIEETNAITEEEFHAQEISAAKFEDLWNSYDQRSRPYSPKYVEGVFSEVRIQDSA